MTRPIGGWKRVLNDEKSRKARTIRRENEKLNENYDNDICAVALHRLRKSTGGDKFHKSFDAICTTMRTPEMEPTARF